MAETESVPRTIWEIDSLEPKAAESVREALRQVVDPEIGLNVIELGLIREVRKNEG